MHTGHYWYDMADYAKSAHLEDPMLYWRDVEKYDAERRAKLKEQKVAMAQSKRETGNRVGMPEFDLNDFSRELL